MTDVVLVHGFWHGAWCWERLVPALRERGLNPVPVDLPLATDRTGGYRGLADDAAAVRAMLRGREDVLLVGHSYGGVVITEAAHGQPSVRHLAYLSAYLPDTGESLLSLHQGAPEGLGLVVGRDAFVDDRGLIAVRDDRIVELFYADCDPVTARAAAGRFAAQPVVGAGQSPAAAAWHDIPSSYIVSLADAAMPLELQCRLAERASEVREVHAGHGSFLARPGELADVLASIAADHVT